MLTLDIFVHKEYSMKVREKEEMVIAFCGHSDYVCTLEDERLVLGILEKSVGNEPCEFFLGEYGGFDRFAYYCAKKFKTVHSNSRLILIIPYINKKTDISERHFDECIYPELEHVPPKYAISHRNRWIAEQADIIIAYITHKYGGAYEMYRHATNRHKTIYNIAPVHGE